jgi:hypothetical protein
MGVLLKNQCYWLLLLVKKFCLNSSNLSKNYQFILIFFGGNIFLKKNLVLKHEYDKKRPLKLSTYMNVHRFQLNKLFETMTQYYERELQHQRCKNSRKNKEPSAFLKEKHLCQQPLQRSLDSGLPDGFFSNQKSQFG